MENKGQRAKVTMQTKISALVKTMLKDLLIAITVDYASTCVTFLLPWTLKEPL